MTNHELTLFYWNSVSQPTFKKSPGILKDTWRFDFLPFTQIGLVAWNFNRIASILLGLLIPCLYAQKTKSSCNKSLFQISAKKLCTKPTSRVHSAPVNSGRLRWMRALGTLPKTEPIIWLASCVWHTPPHTLSYQISFSQFQCFLGGGNHLEAEIHLIDTFTIFQEYVLTCSLVIPTSPVSFKVWDKAAIGISSWLSLARVKCWGWTLWTSRSVFLFKKTLREAIAF